jgi:hypothetical protein
MAPVSGGASISTPDPGTAQVPAGIKVRVFHYPQDDGGYPQTNSVIHRHVHKLSTRYSAIY